MKRNFTQLKKFSSIALIYFLSIICVQPTYAQRPMNGGERPKGSIQGQVIDEASKSEILYASVAIYSKRDSSLVSGAMTSDHGFFTIDDVPAGRYYIMIKFIGFDKKTISNVMVRPPNLNVNLGKIKLHPASTSIEGVEIVGEVTTVEYKIDKKVVNVGNDISNSGGSAVQALENVPSVTVDIDDNVSLRGSSSFQVLINGKPTPLSGSEALQQIPAGAIKNIEIITNPSAKYDPDGMTGIINVVLKKNIKQGLNGMISLTASRFNQYSGDVIFSYQYKKFTFYIGANRRDRGGPGGGHSSLASFYTADTLFRITDLDRLHSHNGFSVKGGFDYEFNKKNTLSFESSYRTRGRNKDFTSQVHEYNTSNTINTYTISNNPGDNKGTYMNFSSNFKHKLDDKGSNWQAFVYYSKGGSSSMDNSTEYLSNANWELTDVLVDGNQSTEEEDNTDFRAKFDFTKYFKNKNRLEFGAQARIRPEYMVNTFAIYDSNQNLIDQPAYGSDLDFRRDIYSAYATYSGQIKSFGYQLGLRGEQTFRNVSNSLTNYNFKINRFDLFPSVHLSQKINKSNQVLLSYSRRIDRPNGWFLEPSIRYISSNFKRIGNPELDPEYMDNFELSYQKTFGKNFIALEGYHHTTNNKITRIQSIDSTGLVTMTFDNVDKDQSMGLELMLNMRPTKWFNFNISGNYYQYKLMGESDALGTVNTTSNNFDMRGNMSFILKTNTRIQLNGFYRGASVTAQGNSSPSFVTSASIRQDFFNRKLSLTFSLRDIFSTGIWEFTTEGTDFYNTNSFYRFGRVYSITASYRINNYKEKRRNGEMRGESEDNLM